MLVEASLVSAVAVSFEASGAVNHLPGCPPQCDSPDGSDLTEHQRGAEHGIADVRAPMNSLLGIFLDGRRPDRSRTPAGLDFGKIGIDFVSWSPQLKQVFFIGTGTTKASIVRRFVVPKGATRLYLGTMDGYEWNNNSGSFSVTVTIERSDVSSNMFSVNSSISFAKYACLPDRSHCTPDREMVEARGPGNYHIVLPAQLEWGASVPTPAGASVTVSGAGGTVCLDVQSCSTGSRIGPQGSGSSGPDFLAPGKAVGALVSKTTGGRTYFSVNDRSGLTFQNHEGYFEFNVTIQ
jgi:hypothetical protein